MESRAISDAQITASSQLDSTHSPRQARLHIGADGSESGGWAALANDFDQWLQVDLGSYTTVTRVATQGRTGQDQWVTKYRIQYSYAGITFKFYKMAENSSAKVYLAKKCKKLFDKRTTKPSFLIAKREIRRFRVDFLS